MKKLCLIRHAKSSWEHPEVDDITRPLDPRGETDAEQMGKLLKQKSVSPDAILASNATRCVDTAKLIAKQLKFSVDKFTIEPMIYEGGVEELLEVIKQLPKACNTAILIGHNPGLTWLANFLAEDHVPNLPTCGVYCVEFDTNDWNDITEVEGKTLFVEHPQEH